MKAKIYIPLMLMVMSVVFSCQEFESEDVSRVTYYALISLNGEQWNQVTQGTTWTDPGATATEADAPVDVVVGGDVVDVNTPGVYTITYTSVNKDGFPSTEYRYVGVIDPAVIGVDITGNYRRDAGVFGVSQVTRVEGNLFQTDNVGGVAEGGPGTTVRFFYYAPGELGVPYQLVNGSPFYCTDATIDEGVSYSWAVVNSGYGTQLRNFIKE